MWTLWPRECFAQYRTAPALPQPARVTAMAGEPARALVTDQITSSSAIPDEDDSRRAMAVTAAGTLVGGGLDLLLFFAPLMFLFLLCVRARHSGTARSHAHGESISLSLDTEKSWSKVRVLGTLVIHINLVSPCF